MPRALSNGLELEYDSFGASSDPAMLLISGFATQMIGWDVRFCEALAAHGFFVLRFDNRDIGLSQRVAGEVDLQALFAGTVSSVPYSLADMASDAVGLLDVMGVDAAHVVGSSMGGMIAQTLAITYPKRVLSLCSIMSTNGDPRVGWTTAEAMSALTSPPATDPPSAATRGVLVGRALSGGRFFDEDAAARRAREAYLRANDPAGVARQLAAVGTQPDRTEGLSAVQIPTLVIHGALDPVFDVSGGEATARAVPNARLVVIEDMGHELPEQLWPQIVAEIVGNARRSSIG